MKSENDGHDENGRDDHDDDRGEIGGDEHSDQCARHAYADGALWPSRDENTEPVALSSATSGDLPLWALRPSASDLLKQHRSTRAPCSVQERHYEDNPSATTPERPRRAQRAEVLLLEPVVVGTVVAAELKRRRTQAEIANDRDVAEQSAVAEGARHAERLQAEARER